MGGPARRASRVSSTRHGTARRLLGCVALSTLLWNHCTTEPALDFTMILVVDDDAAVLKATKRLLEADGHRTESHASAAEALAALTDEEPALIISDILMPEMDGFEFRAAYLERFPERQTPFVFLSGLTDAPHIVRGLDYGADEYFTKPIEPEVFKAKVRALLRRSQRGVGARFSGDMKHLSLVQVLQFCEQRSLTGRAEFSTPQGPISVKFKSGEMELGDDDESANQLAELMDLEKGQFVIESRPVGFEEIEEARRFRVLPKAPPPAIPMGRLSGVRVGSRTFQLQTEYEPPPVDQVVTVVILDGQVLQKRATKPTAGLDGADLRAMMAEQHGEVEQELQAKLEAFLHEPSESPPPSSEEDDSASKQSAAPVAEPSESSPPSTEEDDSVSKQSEVPAAESEVPEAALGKPAIPPPPPFPAREPPGAQLVADQLGSQIPMLSELSSSPAVEKERLFDLGLRKWRENDLQGALVALELAHAASPGDRELKATLNLVRRKLKAT